MNTSKKARQFFEENKDMFAYFLNKERGKPVAVPKEISDMIRTEDIKNIGTKLEDIEISRQLSYHHALETSVKEYN